MDYSINLYQSLKKDISPKTGRNASKKVGFKGIF
jgi:hypothetical protein